jgi:hypothetical protein
VSGIDDIRRRLDACYEGTVRERGEAEMEFHRHAMIDVERLLDVAEALSRLTHCQLCYREIGIADLGDHASDCPLRALDQAPVT